MRSFRLMLFPAITLVLLTYIYLTNISIFTNPDNIARFYLQNFKAGNIGYGLEGKYYNQISFEGLEPGDILVGGYPQCAYGRFSHAGVYIGNNLVVESYGDLGVNIQSINHYWNYSEIALLKVATSKEAKAEVVDYVKSYEGAIFYPVAFKPGDRIWNCSKIIWQAYMEQGIDLDESGDLWIPPDAFYNSKWTRVIREKGR